jgi:hypothetical protein
MLATTTPRAEAAGSPPLPPAILDWLGGNRQASDHATKAARARNRSNRRRLVDPTTCDRDYSAAEVEFLQAIQEYKRVSGRMFPTWGEILEVLHGLGSRKPAAPVAH